VRRTWRSCTLALTRSRCASRCSRSTSPCGRGDGAEDGGGGAAALEGAFGGLGELPQGFDGFAGDLFAPEIALEVEQGAEGIKGFAHAGFGDPAGESEQGDLMGGGEGDGVCPLGERLEEALLGLGEGGRERLEDEGDHTAVFVRLPPL
jgi:hypothetical protein